jgi:hypothetical protein
LSAYDAATLGYGVPSSMKSEVEQAHANLGYLNPVAEGIGYTVGPGKILGPIARGIAGAGLRGAALEGAAAGGAGAYGHGGSGFDVATGMLTGGVGGAGAGALGVGAGTLARRALGPGAGPGSAAGDVTAALKATRDAKYGALNDVFYRPNDALDMVNNVRGDIAGIDPGGDLLANAPKTSAALQAFENQVSNNPTTTAGGLGTLHQRLGEIMGGPNGGAEAEIAGPFRNRVEEMMRNAQPVNPGMSPGDASSQLAAAKQAHSNYANASMLEDMRNRLDVFGDMPGSAAKSALLDNPQFYDGPANQAMLNIAKTGGGAPSTWSLAHSLHPLAAGAVGGLGLTGHAALAAGGAGTYLAVAPLLHAAEMATQRAAARRAITDAYPALTGGQTLANPEQRTGELIKNLLMGRLAGGETKPTDYVPSFAAPLVYSTF